MSGMSVYATNAPKVASVNLQIPQEYPVYFYHGARNSMYLGGCQNYGPFLDPQYNTAPNI